MQEIFYVKNNSYIRLVCVSENLVFSVISVVKYLLARYWIGLIYATTPSGEAILTTLMIRVVFYLSWRALQGLLLAPFSQYFGVVA